MFSFQSSNQYPNGQQQNSQSSFEVASYSKDDYNTETQIFSKHVTQRHSEYHISNDQKRQSNGVSSPPGNTDFVSREKNFARARATMNNAPPVSMEGKTGNCLFNSKLANLSQGSCDNTPDTPDSLDSLVGSESEGVGVAVHRDDDEEDQQLSITEAEASSQSLEVQSPLSPDRGIFSSLGGIHTSDMASEYLMPLVSHCNDYMMSKNEGLQPSESQSISSPKYTTSPFPSGLEINHDDSKSVSSSVTSLSCPQTAYWNTSTGNLSSCQISQRDNLIEEVSTPVPMSQQTDLVSPQKLTPSKMPEKAPHIQVSPVSRKQENTKMSNRNVNISPLSSKCDNKNSFIGSHEQPLLSSSCTPTLGDSQQSTPIAARDNSLPSSTSETPPLISSYSRDSQLAFETSSITTANLEMSNITESDKLTTPFSSTKSSINSTSPSSNFTSTLCAQSSSTTPICKFPCTASVSIPSNCSSLVSSQTSMKQSNPTNSTNTLEKDYAMEMPKNTTAIEFAADYDRCYDRSKPPRSSIHTVTNPKLEERLKNSPAKPYDTRRGYSNVTNQNKHAANSPSMPRQQNLVNKKEMNRYIMEHGNQNVSEHQIHSNRAFNERNAQIPITKQPSRTSNIPIPSGSSDAYKPPVLKEHHFSQQYGTPSNHLTKVPEKPVSIAQGNGFKLPHEQFDKSNNNILLHRTTVTTPQSVHRVNNEKLSSQALHGKRSEDGILRNQVKQQGNSALGNQMPMHHLNKENMATVSGGGFVLHSCQPSNDYEQPVHPPNQQDYFYSNQQPIYMAIIPAQGHQMMQENTRITQPNQSPSCNYKGENKQFSASPSIISGLPFSGSPHYATLGRIAKDSRTGNMVFISCDAGGNPSRVDPAFIQGVTTPQMRTSCSNPQLQTMNVSGGVQRRNMSRSMSQDHTNRNRNASQPASPKIGHPPSANQHKDQGMQQLSPMMLQRRAKEQQQQQDVTNRYATIGRNNHKTYYKPPQQSPSPQINRLQQDLEATKLKKIPKANPSRLKPESPVIRHNHRSKPESPVIKQSQVEKLNARKVNHNLASTTLTNMSANSCDTRKRFDARESLPLVQDVRKMATNVILQQPIPFSHGKLPLPGGPMGKQESSFMDTKISPQDSHFPEKKVESLYNDKDIQMSESESESDKDCEEEDDEEEKIRKDASLPTILLPKPKRKPPFTIEGAMNSILKRNKKTEKPLKEDNVRFEKENDLENLDNRIDSHLPKDDSDIEEKRLFGLLGNEKNGNLCSNKNNNKDTNDVSNDDRKKRSAFSFPKLRANLRKTSTQPKVVIENDNENNNTSIDLDAKANCEENHSAIEKTIPDEGYRDGPSNADEIVISQPSSASKFDSMERRRMARILKTEGDDEKQQIFSKNENPIDNLPWVEQNGMSITNPIQENLKDKHFNKHCNSSTTSRESFDTKFIQPNPSSQETINNMISHRFKKRWKRSKKSAPPPPPPNQLNNKEGANSVKPPMFQNILPNGYAFGGGKKEAKGDVSKDTKSGEIDPNLHNDEKITAATDSSLGNKSGGFFEDASVENQRLQGRNNCEIIGTRREVLDEELLVDLRDLDQTKTTDNCRPEDREPFPISPLNEDRRTSKQVKEGCCLK